MIAFKNHSILVRADHIRDRLHQYFESVFILLVRQLSLETVEVVHEGLGKFGGVVRMAHLHPDRSILECDVKREQHVLVFGLRGWEGLDFEFLVKLVLQVHVDGGDGADWHVLLELKLRLGMLLLLIIVILILLVIRALLVMVGRVVAATSVVILVLVVLMPVLLEVVVLIAFVAFVAAARMLLILVIVLILGVVAALLLLLLIVVLVIVLVSMLLWLFLPNLLLWEESLLVVLLVVLLR